MKYPYQDPELSVEKRIDDLLSKMSIEEKLGQMEVARGSRFYHREGREITILDSFKHLFTEYPIGSLNAFFRADWVTGKNWENGITPELMADARNMFQKYAMENSRWGIPLIFGEETVHGIMAMGTTVFPTGLGMGSSWNIDLMESVAEVIRKEAQVAGINSGYFTIDIIRDPRWGRSEECFGEDPYHISTLTSKMTEVACCDAMKNQTGFMITLKHFLAHGASEGGHNQGPVSIGPVELYNTHLIPFRDCISAGAKGVMTCYNCLDGCPCTGDRELLTEILRNKLNFNGFVLTDANSIFHLYWEHFAEDNAEACSIAIKAGVDKDLVPKSELFFPAMKDALKRGLLSVEDIDHAVANCLRVKFELGLFEYPFAQSGNPVDILSCNEHRKIALKAAQESLVLLSNPRDILPLSNIKKLVVVGPNADTYMNQLGDYTAIQKREDIITVLDGIKDLALKRSLDVSYAKGCKIRSMNKEGFIEALKVANDSDAVVLVLGGSSTPDESIMFNPDGAAVLKNNVQNLESDKDSGEGCDRASLRLGGVQLELLKKLKATGKPIIVVLIIGRPMILTEVLETADAVLLAWHPGMMGGQAVAEALFGEYNPGGKLPVSFPDYEGQLPVYYNAPRSGSWPQPRRDYIDTKSTPTLQFGHGLSYTTFEYSNLKLDKNVINMGDTVAVSVDIQNTGKCAGDEVVQMYITDQVASVARPCRELRGFKRIHLKAGEKLTVKFTIGKEELGFYNKELEYVVEPGKFTVAVGGALDKCFECEFEIGNNLSK